MVREEIAELKLLAEEAQSVEGAGSEAKLSRLKDLLHKEGFLCRRRGAPRPADRACAS